MAENSKTVRSLDGVIANLHYDLFIIWFSTEMERLRQHGLVIPGSSNYIICFIDLHAYGLDSRANELQTLLILEYFIRFKY